MPQFRFGDVVQLKPSQSNQNMELNFALFYDMIGDDIRLLAVSGKQEPDYLRAVKIGKKDLVEGNLAKDVFIIIDRMIFAKNESVLKRVGEINRTKKDEVLRTLAHEVIEKHYEFVHKDGERFTPGKTYIFYGGTIYDADDMKNLTDATLDFRLAASTFTKQFEEEFARFLGTKYCILTNSGSSANLLAISALTAPELGERRLRPGDEVLTTACAFPTTVNPIIQNNLIPVFIDIDLGTYNVQADKVQDALSDRTKAIFLAHTLGNPFDLSKIGKICRDNDLWLIEDNCDALGAKYQGRYTGTFGDIATSSFYPPHHITMGEGGALVTNDTQLRKMILSFRDWGRDCWCEPGHDNTCGRRFEWQLGTLPLGYDHKYIYAHIGYNLKVTDMQAAVGVSQLKKLPAFIEARKRNWRRFCDGLRQYEEYFVLPEPLERSDPSWFGFALTIREGAPFRRNELVNYLEEKKIATRLLFSGNITRHPCFQNTKYRIYGDLKNTDLVTENTFWIGVYPGLSDEMIKYILGRFDEFLKKK